VVKGTERADTLVRETPVQATLTAKCGKVAFFLRLRILLKRAIKSSGVGVAGRQLFKYIQGDLELARGWSNFD
jgi:hypothetical protein